MNELDERLAAWNPVEVTDVYDAAASADAFDLLQHILSQPRTSPFQRQSRRARRPTKAWIAAAAAVAVAAAGIGVSESLPGRNSTRPAASALPVIGFQRATSQGLASNAVELVDYAIRAAALTPKFVPGPHYWMYRDLIQKIGPRRNREVTWWEVNFHHMFVLDGGKLTPEGSSTGSCVAQLSGWPGCINTVYRYLAKLPVNPATLRRIILANNHSDPTAAFNAIEYLMLDYPLPARFQAELYAVLTGLRGVRFDRSAKDFAGRRGIGLYIIENGFLKREIIINPRTYAYMGSLWVAVKAHTEHGTSPAVVHLHKGSVVGWNAILGSAIVQKAGQRH
jgi:hypothetical protein